MTERKARATATAKAKSRQIVDSLKGNDRKKSRGNGEGVVKVVVLVNDRSKMVTAVRWFRERNGLEYPVVSRYGC